MVTLAFREEPFAVGVALILGGAAVLGWIVVRLQRDRQHFKLMQAALERGITTMPGLLPVWLISLRQGVLVLALGLGLLVIGLIVPGRAGQWFEPPPPPDSSGAGPGAGGPNETQPMPRPGEPLAPPGIGPGGRDGPPDMGLPPPGSDRRNPPPPSPEVRRWQRAQSEHLTELLLVSAGSVLMLLGSVRIVFALVEKRYTQNGSARP